MIALRASANQKKCFLPPRRRGRPAPSALSPQPPSLALSHPPPSLPPWPPPPSSPHPPPLSQAPASRPPWPPSPSLAPPVFAASSSQCRAIHAPRQTPESTLEGAPVGVSLESHRRART